jgi:hypothetical protein
MLKIVKLIIATTSAGLCAGIGTEIITNPEIMVSILDKTFGMTSKIILMLPIIGTLMLCIEKKVKI